ncbi:MAG: hypothetical protein K2N38_03470 [Oscillospiraceae bacterium]|nr:hypothetical protein [Oscillospiraceae bacterium]
MRFNGTVTVYNTVEVDFKKTLFPRLLECVHVEITRGADKAAGGDKNTDKLLLIVPFSGHEDVSLNVGDPVAVGDTMSQGQRQKGGRSDFVAPNAAQQSADTDTMSQGQRQKGGRSDFVAPNAAQQSADTDTMSQGQRQKGGRSDFVAPNAAQQSADTDVGEADNFAELTARAEAEAAPRTFRITSVKTFDFGGLKHWEVIAK